MNVLPKWVLDIVEQVNRRAVIWQALNGLPKTEIRPEDQQTLHLVGALALALRSLDRITSATTLDEAKTEARQSMLALWEGPKQGGRA